MAIEMDGAALRHQRERSNVWAAAMMPHMKKPPSFQDFVGVKHDRAAYVRRFDDAWNRLDAALRRNRP